MPRYKKNDAPVSENGEGFDIEQEMRRRGLTPQFYARSPLQNAGMDVEEGQEVNSNTRIITKNLEIMDLPPIDLHDGAAVRARIREYFAIEAKWGFKPTMAGLGNALGLDRRRLWEIKTGTTSDRHQMGQQLPKDVRDSIKKAYTFMEQNWEDYMQNGKINPVAGIFLGKNNYGYQDKTEYVITPNQNEQEYSQAEIRERLGLPPTDEEDT